MNNHSLMTYCLPLKVSCTGPLISRTKKFSQPCDLYGKEFTGCYSSSFSWWMKVKDLLLDSETVATGVYMLHGLWQSRRQIMKLSVNSPLLLQGSKFGIMLKIKVGRYEFFHQLQC